jgi:hypothetical protein
MAQAELSRPVEPRSALPFLELRLAAPRPELWEQEQAEHPPFSARG